MAKAATVLAKRTLRFFIVIFPFEDFICLNV
ncbi:hypothetical protein QE432_000412 [Agrobacterium sp. SORGH_AS 745]|jgi:hypothetical protein|nr:hypothetical protein [Agrobacterium sp. SORGH_AS_0745]